MADLGFAHDGIGFDGVEDLEGLGDGIGQLVFVFDAAFFAGHGDAEELRAAIGDGQFVQAGRFGEDAGIGAVAAHDRSQGAVAAGFFVDHAFDDDIAAQFNAGGLQRHDAQYIADDAAFHIGAAAAVDLAVDEFAAPGSISPEFRRSERHDIEVAVEFQRPAAAAATVNADHIGAIGVGEARGHESRMGGQLVIVGRPAIDLETEGEQFAL